MPENKEGGLSAKFRIFEARQFSEDLARLGPAAQEQIQAKLREYVSPLLGLNPYFGPNIKRLKNWEPPTWRYRVGDWRFFYEVDSEKRIVFMSAADHPKSAYR